MGVDQLAEGDAHLLFHHAGALHVAGDAEQLGAGVVGLAQRGEPAPAAAQDLAHVGDGFHVVHRARAAVQPGVGRERRLQPRLALLALHGFDQRRFLAADVGPRAVVHHDVQIPAEDAVLAKNSGIVGLLHRGLERLALGHELAAEVDVGRVRLHRAGGEDHALDEPVRVVAQDLAVLAGAGLGFVGVDDEVMRPLPHLFRHERPLQPRGEARATTPAQTGSLHLLDDPVPALRDEPLHAVIDAAGQRALQPRVVQPVEVRVDAVLITQHRLLPIPSHPARGPGPAQRPLVQRPQNGGGEHEHARQQQPCHLPGGEGDARQRHGHHHETDERVAHAVA